MENRTEHFSEEKIYCHTYDGLVREMASAMEVDSQKLFPKTEGEFDHEDIESWIGAVKFKEGKVPDIQASLSSDRGLRVIKFEVADQKGIESLDEKATKEELIYSMALTEAKMKVVSDIAEEVYPAVAFQIKDYRREIEKVREEILGDKRENTSLDEAIHGVLSKKTLAAAVIIGGMVLSACGVSVEIVTPNATATETQPRVTETVDIGVTETPFQPGVTETAPGISETPTLEVTPTATQVEGEMTAEEIKSNVDAYLDGKITFEGDREKYLYRRRSGLILPVGYFYEYRMTFPQFEMDSDTMISVLLGIYRDGDKQFMVLGSKDLNGKSFVWVGITGYLDNEKYPALSRTYIKLTHEESPIIDGSVGNNMFKNQDELLELYSDKINLPLYYGIDANMVIKDPSFTCGPIMNELECGSAKGNNGASDELIAWIKEGKNKPDFVFDNISDFQIKEFENAPLVQNHTVNTP